MSDTPTPQNDETAAAEGTTPPFWMTGTSAADDASESGELAEDAGLAAERERLSRQLRDTRVQLAMTQTRLSALEQSSTMKFGRTIANAAKKPWPRGALLPRDLYKLWRDRGAPKSGAQNAANALAQAQLADLKGTGGRFLSQLTAPGMLILGDPALALAGAGNTPALVITGAISALGCATLAPDALVHPLLPHDADIMVEATGADLVIIQASALLPGEPWAHATDPAAADRGRRLARMIVMARGGGGMSDDAYERGMEVRREVLGDAHVDAAIERTTEFTADFQEYITRTVWGGIWARPGLDRRMRSAVTLTALIATGREGELAMHVRAALRNGLSAEEIKEILLQTGAYCGVPAANGAFAIAQAVLAEEGDP